MNTKITAGIPPVIITKQFSLAFAIFAPIAIIAATSVWAAQPVAPSEAAAASCSALESTDFDDIQDAPTKVAATHLVSPTEEMPEHCHVDGYVAQNVGFSLRLPTSSWNGKFLVVGPGGMGGLSGVSEMAPACADGLRRGYACISHDSGHKGQGTADSLWAYNNLQAVVDWAVRSSHVVALAGKAIVQRYYGAAPKASYFRGCSGGGRSALVEAQRFPWDFDGIIVQDPSASVGLNGLITTLLWNALATHDKSGKALFAPADLDLLHSASIRRCDLNDGLKDGIIDDPTSCKVDPSELKCKGDKTASCLLPIQVDAAMKLYSGPMTSKGEKYFFGGIMPGSENGPMLVAGDGIHPITLGYFRYLAFSPNPGPKWMATDFDWDKDYKRVGVSDAINSDNNPDIRQFKRTGGKMIFVQSVDDGGHNPLRSVDYYETVERVMGGRDNTQDFFRLFMVPGAAHCGGTTGDGPNVIDVLSHLEAWVETGRAPGMMVAGRVLDTKGDYFQFPKDGTKVLFTRPIYPYPVRAKYKGSGDPKDYWNFRPMVPKPSKVK